MSKWDADDAITTEELQVARPQNRQFVALLVISAAFAQVLGVTMKSPTQLEANDISRWCTVASLLERGTYAIDDCPWQARTQDKVLKPDKLTDPSRSGPTLARLEYALAPQPWKTGEPTKRFYSSKPPLLPTMIAAVLYPIRKATGISVEDARLSPRVPKEVEQDDPEHPGQKKKVLVDQEPIKWNYYVFYFKPMIVLLNVVPMLFYLILYARLLDRYARNDWAWMLSLFATAFGTFLFTFDQTLNNHTVAAYSAFFAIYLAIKIWDDENASGWTYAGCGFWGAFTAANELPAALFGILLFLAVFFKSPRKTLLCFVPMAMIPILAFLITQYAAMGQFKPVYEEFGTETYNYEGSYWNAPLEFDYFNVKPESKALYLFHMTFGHHGVFSLTPIVLFAMIGMVRSFRGISRGMAVNAVITLLLTIAMLAFYDWNPKARNYGGSTQGLRWLFWLIPFWMIALPPGVEPGQERRFYRWLTILALVGSVYSVGYSLRHPWSHPWIVDFMEQVQLYSLRR